MGIYSAGHRLDILKAIYRLKVDNAIPIEPDHYVPLCEVIFHGLLSCSEFNSTAEANEDVFPENTPLGKLMRMIATQSQYSIRPVRRLWLNESLFLDDRIRTLEQELQKLQADNMPFEEYAPSRTGNGLQKQPSFKWAQYGRSVRSPTKTMPDDSNGAMLQPHDSPRASPHALEHGDIHVRIDQIFDHMSVGLNTARVYSSSRQYYHPSLFQR
jgi:hypothetical protein